MATEDEIRAASERFYSALNHMANGDAGKMADIWSGGVAVTALHPIGGRSVGWDAVRESFAQFAQSASDGKVELRDQLIHVAGDVAYEVGVESGQLKLGGENLNIEHRVTNIYQRQGEGWKIIHHHADTSPAMQDWVRRH